MIAGIHHTSRTVGNMERSLRFYRDLLGMEVVLDTEMLEREVGLPGAHLRLVALGGANPKPNVPKIEMVHAMLDAAVESEVARAS